MLIVIMHNFVIPAVIRTVLMVRSTPCLSIQLAMSPGIIFPITIKSVVPKPAVIIFSDRDRYPNRKPISNARTNLLLPYTIINLLNNLIIRKVRMLIPKVIINRWGLSRFIAIYPGTIIPPAVTPKVSVRNKLSTIPIPI